MRRKDVFNLKQEYHHFRSRVAQTMLLLSSLLLAGMWHAEALAGWPQPAALRAMQGALRYTFSPLIMFGVQVRYPAVTHEQRCEAPGADRRRVGSSSHHACPRDRVR